MMHGGLVLFLLLGFAAGDEIEPRPYGKIMGDGLALMGEPMPTGGGVCAPGETVFGIDVSYYQGNINWQAAAADGVKYAIIRVSHSTQFFDPEFYDNLEGARAAGIHTGVYQYFEPDEDPIAQADLLLESLGPLMPGDLPPMIDVESTGGLGPGAITTAIHAWIDRVESELGVKPIVYSGYYFWNDNVGSSDFGDYPLMLPWYGVDCPGGVPNGWNMWTIHQYCDCGSVAGIGGAVDVDRFNGSLADLEKLAVGECGDGICTGAEDPYRCAQDCPPCGTIPAAGGTIDNGDECYRLYGNAQFWREEPQGEGGSLVWTHATDYDEVYNYAIWQLHLAESGRYEVEVHVTQPFGETTQAAYQVRHADGESTVAIDQSASDGWISLGQFAFDAATDHSVRLDDNTGEPADADIMIVYDALRLVRLDGETPTTGEPAGTDDGPPAGTDGDDGPPLPDDATVDSEGGATDALPPRLGDEDEGGCACRASPRGGWGFALLALFAFVSRRRW